MKRIERENRWGAHPANGGFAPERFPAFSIEMTARRDFEGPGNVSSTDYHLVASDGRESVEIVCTNRSGTTSFRFRGQTYFVQVSDGDEGTSYSVVPAGPDGKASSSPESASLPWLPFDLDGVRIDEETDLSALVTRALAGWTPPAARGLEGEGPARWTLKLWSSLAGTSLQDEVSKAAGTCLRSTDARARAAALQFFDRAGYLLPGAEAIEEVASRADSDPLDAVRDPTGSSGGATLGMLVRIGLSSRIRSLQEKGIAADHAIAIAKRLRSRHRGAARRARRGALPKA